MSEWQPRIPDGLEGVGSEGRVAFSNDEKQWTESFDLVRELGEILDQAGHDISTHEHWIETSGLYLYPNLADLQPLDDGGVKTVTTVSVAHPRFAPHGVFEFQHSIGTDVSDSLIKGLRDWFDLDFPVFWDAVCGELDTCTGMEMEFPGPDHRRRRAVLGPVSHRARRTVDIDEEHPFCQCCLLTNCFDAFRDHFEGDEVYAIRLLALRDSAGTVNADCRINGMDYEPGKEALIRYGNDWPDRGVEMRKQYVLIYSE